MRSRGIAALLAVATLAGCIPSPELRTPEVTPAESWSHTTDVPGPVISEWWKSFDDPQLDALVLRALEGNQDLAVAVARLDRARAEARIAGADLKPSVGAGLNATRQNQKFIGTPIPDSTSTRYDASVEVSWEADLWGRIRAGARAAVADYEASEADLRGARMSIAAATVKLWFSIAEVRQQMELAESSAISFSRLAEQIRARYVIGVRPAIDLRLALSNASAAAAEYERRRIQLDGLVRQVEVLIGDYPSGTLLERHPPGPPVDRPAPVPAGLPSELLARRPDLVAAERRLVAADQRWAAARRSLYPRLTLTARGGTASDQLDDLLDGDFTIWSLLGGLTQPLFQGGRLRANVDRTAAITDEALARYTGAVLLAYAEVESALNDELLLTEQRRHTADSADQLVAAEALAEERYRSGLGDYLAVLESQTRAFTAQSRLLTLERVRLDRRVDLHLALGGGFESDFNLPDTDGKGDPS
jgi:NodT family efflux transporter outer membrane factor (OMF) lipoprotein